VTSWLPGLLLALAAAIAAIMAHIQARAQRKGGDCGDFWARVVRGFCPTLGLALLASASIETLWPSYWRTGRHLHLDVTGGFGLPFFACFIIALLLPVVCWLGFMGFGLAQWRPSDQRNARWLAGILWEGGTRFWVAWFALPLVLLLIWTASRLGGGPGAFPAAVWSTLALVAVSLLAVALSAGAEQIHQKEAARKQEEVVPGDWPADMKSSGITLRHLATWTRSASKGGIRDRATAAWSGPQAAAGIAPELIDAIDSLLRPDAAGDEHAYGPIRVILAPDDCGQVESIALAAESMAQRYQATTLVVSSEHAEQLADSIKRWAPQESRVGEIDRSGAPPEDAAIWVCDANVLSERLLPRLNDPFLSRRIGLVVWWDLHDYTGVRGANSGLHAQRPLLRRADQ